MDRFEWSAAAMTMHVNLSSEMESFIKSKVNSGFYGSATEVIRDAVRRMQAEDERRTAFHAAIAVGQAELDRGEMVRYSPDLMEEMWQDAMENSRLGKPINPDVRP